MCDRWREGEEEEGQGRWERSPKQVKHVRGAKLVLQPPGQGGEKGGDGPAGWGTSGSWGGSGMHHVSCSCCSLIWFWWIMHGEGGPVLKGHRCHSGSHYWARHTDEKKKREKENESKKERGRGMGMETERKNKQENTYLNLLQRSKMSLIWHQIQLLIDTKLIISTTSHLIFIYCLQKYYSWLFCICPNFNSLPLARVFIANTKTKQSSETSVGILMSKTKLSRMWKINHMTLFYVSFVDGNLRSL